MELLAHTRIVMWQGASLWVINATRPSGIEPRRTDFHAHHAIQATVSLGGTFRLATADTHVAGEVVAVAADTPHEYEAEGLAAMVFIEPESRLGRAVASNLFGDSLIAAVPAALLGDVPPRIAAAFRAPDRDDDALVDLGQALVAALAGDARADIPDPRVRRMIQWAVGQIEGPISLADAVAVGGLSASRLRHLFVEQTGLPFRTYLLWLRLTRAVQSFASGASLTEAAHEAGFADQAHFSRTFRRMFGIAPAALRMA